MAGSHVPIPVVAGRVCMEPKLVNYVSRYKHYTEALNSDQEYVSKESLQKKIEQAKQDILDYLVSCPNEKLEKADI